MVFGYEAWTSNQIAVNPLNSFFRYGLRKILEIRFSNPNRWIRSLPKWADPFRIRPILRGIDPILRKDRPDPTRIDQGSSRSFWGSARSQVGIAHCLSAIIWDRPKIGRNKDEWIGPYHEIGQGSDVHVRDRPRSLWDRGIGPIHLWPDLSRNLGSCEAAKRSQSETLYLRQNALETLIMFEQRLRNATSPIPPIRPMFM